MTTAALQDLFYPENRCFGCGPANADGLHVKTYEADDGYVAEWTPEQRFAGPPGVVNGGMVAVPMDCHATWAAMHTFSRDRGGEPVGAVTAGYSVRLLRPMPIGQRVRLHAEVTSHDERKAKVSVTASLAGEVLATFDGTFVVVDMFDEEPTGAPGSGDDRAGT
ncbi:MAG: PaaI family thioesterase [Actinobacteria bacterium]|nr:PaaI family thioesterase [Actinomycetota bacterium]